MTGAPILKGLRVAVDGTIATVTINNPPMNLLDQVLIDSLEQLGLWLERNETLKVVVFASADPDFFIAHADLKMLETMPRAIGPKSAFPSAHQLVVDRFQTLPQVTIGRLEGIARGGGSEFLLALDMRFGAIGRAVLSQPEVALGFSPGCGATQRLPRLIGRSHALEAILGCGDYDARDAERVGWLNRALPAEELGTFVDKLVARIASFPRSAIVAAKSAIASGMPPLAPGLCDEFLAFRIAYSSEVAQGCVERALERGFQTRELESGPLDGWFAKLAENQNSQGRIDA